MSARRTWKTALANPTQCGRDPFARATFYRLTVPKEDRTSCYWCGRPAKFQYAAEYDGTQFGINWPEWTIQFCGIYCARMDYQK